jgi:hypothetical protein
MKLSEILESGAGRFYYTSLYNDYGIKLINNSPEELESAISEMDDMIKGECCEKSVILNQSIKKLFSDSVFHGKIKSKVATRCLLDDSIL